MNREIEKIKKTLTKTTPYEDAWFMRKVSAEFSVKYSKSFLVENVRTPLLTKRNEYMKTPRYSLVGKFYLFEYFPSTNIETWDRFPLIFLMEKGKNSFIGLNFHFLSKTRNIDLFEKMENKVKNEQVSLNYPIVKLSYLEHRGITRRYHMKNIKSPMVEIPFEYIKIFLLMNIQEFFSPYTEIGVRRKTLERIYK